MAAKKKRKDIHIPQKHMTPRQNRRALRIISLVLIIAVAGTLIIFNNGGSNEPVYTPSRNLKSTDPYHFNKEGELAFLKSPGDTITTIDVEIADDPAQRTQGLMFRRQMKEDQGMLFLFPYEEVQSFWMKNTVISLDIIFADENGRIVKIHENTVPLDENRYLSESLARYVVEVRAGFTARHGIEEGDLISWQRR